MLIVFVQESLIQRFGIQPDKLLCELNGWERGEAWKRNVERIPLGRGGLPEDIGNGAVMLLVKIC